MAYLLRLSGALRPVGRPRGDRGPAGSWTAAGHPATRRRALDPNPVPVGRPRPANLGVQVRCQGLGITESQRPACTDASRLHSGRIESRARGVPWLFLEGVDCAVLGGGSVLGHAGQVLRGWAGLAGLPWPAGRTTSMPAAPQAGRLPADPDSPPARMSCRDGGSAQSADGATPMRGLERKDRGGLIRLGSSVPGRWTNRRAARRSWSPRRSWG
jgi:hypothetical protein